MKLKKVLPNWAPIKMISLDKLCQQLKLLILMSQAYINNSLG